MDRRPERRRRAAGTLRCLATFEFDAHWALYVENYLEGLHVPFVHPGLAQTLELGTYTVELGRWCTLQLAHALAGEPAFEPPAGSPDHGQRIAAYCGWVFPNLMLNFYPWGLSLNQVLPLGPSKHAASSRATSRCSAAGVGRQLSTYSVEKVAALSPGSICRGHRLLTQSTIVDPGSFYGVDFS